MFLIVNLCIPAFLESPSFVFFTPVSIPLPNEMSIRSCITIQFSSNFVLTSLMILKPVFPNCCCKFEIMITVKLINWCCYILKNLCRKNPIYEKIICLQKCNILLCLSKRSFESNIIISGNRKKLIFIVNC